MGYMVHHAIIVTSWDDKAIEAAHIAAVDAVCRTKSPGWVSPIGPPAINGYRTFLIAPDGSKEGWSDSHAGDAAREEFMAWVTDAATREIWLEVAHVQYADEGGDNRLLNP